jgi:hypothetical protein
MNLAYIITAYRLPEQLARLVRRLDSPAAHFFVHVDARSPTAVYQAMTGALRPMPNVCFVKRFRSYWGEFGHVEGMLQGIEEIVARRIECDYVYLLSGQDYPIKPLGYFEDLLRQSAGRSHVEYAPLPRPDWRNGGLERIESWHFRLAKWNFVLGANPRYQYRIFSRQRTVVIPGFTGRRPFLKSYQPFGGWATWCLAREAVDYVHWFTRHNPWFSRFFRRVNIPDEIFFQTLLLNSPLKDKVLNQTLTYMDWSKPKAPLGPADLEVLLASPKVFARKFDITREATILDKLDEITGFTGRTGPAAPPQPAVGAPRAPAEGRLELERGALE